MAARYSRLPSDDIEAGDTVAFDFGSPHTYGSPAYSAQKYSSIFTYGRNEQMKRSDVELSVEKQSFSSRICGHVITVICFIIVVLTFPISAWKSFKIVSPTERLVVFRLGRLQGAKGPGLVFVIPCVDRCQKVDIRVKAFNVPPLQLLTLDAGIIEMGADVYYKINNAVQSITSVQDLNQALRGLVRNTLLNHLVKFDLQDIDMRKHEIITDVLTACNALAKGWGVEISRMEWSPIKILQRPKEGASLPPGMGGEEGLTQVFQQLAQSFMSPGGQRAPNSQLQIVNEDASGAAVACEDIRLSSGPTPRELLFAVKGVVSDTLVRNVGAVYQFNLSGSDGGVFFMDLKHGSGQVGEGPDPRQDPDVSLDLSVKDMQQMFTGKLKPLQAYMSGRLKVSGDLSAAMRLEEVMDKVISKNNSSSVAGHTVVNI